MKYINQTARCGVIYRNDALSTIGIYDHQHAYILNICHKPGIRQDEIAKLIHVNKSNVTRQLAHLESQGLIIRKPSDVNRKHIHLYPTEKCFDIYPVIKETLSHWNETLLEDFSEDEIKSLEKLMQKLTRKAEEIIGGCL